MSDIKKVAKEEMLLTRGAIQAFPWEDPEAYKVWLAQTYHMVKHSTRLVALAAAYADLKQNDLHIRFVDHAKEERSHELLCVHDLKALGSSLEQLPSLYPATVMAQNQYYWIQHRGPLSLFGYILSLECLAAEFGQKVYDRVVKAHGKDAARFIKTHAEDDVEHVEKALNQVSQVPAPVMENVIENLKLSAVLYRTMLSEIRSYVAQSEEKLAA